MAALPPVPNVFRLSFQHSYGGNTRVFNHKYFKYSGTLNGADAATLVAHARAAWITDVLQNGLSTSLTLTNTILTDLNSLSGAVAIDSTTGSGANAGTALSAGVAIVVEMQIARRFRGGHARLYLAGLTSTNLATLETISGALQTALQTGLVTFDTAMNTGVPAAVGTVLPCTVSYFKGFSVVAPLGKRARNVPILNPAGPQVDLITGYKANPHVASQRRRNQQSL